MKKVFWLTVCILVTVMGSAQTQKGYVKTKGRLGNNGTVITGTRLSGATVKVKGGNAVVSGSNGAFSLAIPSNSYYLQNVQKQGYVLTDPDVLSKQYAYSKNPLVLVLETPSQQTDDKLAAEKKIRRTLQRQLQQKEDEIETLKEQHKVSEEEYRKQLQEIYAQQENNEKLINEMADRYSKIDFDEVDEFNRRISDCIINGRLTEADSLLNTKGDINTRAATLRQHQEANAQAEQELTIKLKKLEKSKAITKKELEDLAQDCYSKFEIFMMQHQNDSAAFYIELRAKLDTTNVDWQNEAGLFANDYLANYSLGLNYFLRALACAQKPDADNSVLLECYNNLGVTHEFLGNNTMAMEYYQKCLDLCKEDSISMSTILRHIAIVYYDQDDYNEALSYYQKALVIREKQSEDDKESIARLYRDIGNVYNDLGNFNLAKEYLEKAYELFNKDKGDKSLPIAGCLLNMGFNYRDLNDNDKAMECFQKALEIYIEFFGERHPHVAVTYGGIASVYGRKKDYANQLKYSTLCLNIKKKIYGDKHPSIGVGLNNIGLAYLNMKEYDKSIESFLQSLEISRMHYGEKNGRIAVLYRNLGFLYKELGQNDCALDYYLKSFKLAQDLYGDSNQIVQVSANYLGRQYYLMKNYPMAVLYLKQNLAITEKVYEGNTSKLRSAVNLLFKAYNAELEENKSDKELRKEFDEFKKKYSQHIDNLVTE